MSVLKLAYVRGAQNALVTSGAIRPYSSKFKANLAVKLASLAIRDKLAEEVSDEELAAAMAAMSSNAEEELSPEEAAAVMEMAEEGSEDLEELQESAGEEDEEDEESDEEAAREVVAYLKAAADGHFEGGVANPAPSDPGDFETEAGARAAADYANLHGAQGLADPAANAMPFTASMKPLAEGVSLDAKTAAYLLRKLSEDAANSSANMLGGAGVGGEDEETEGGARGSESYANMSSQGPMSGSDNAAPFTGNMMDHGDNVSESATDLGKTSAFNYLLRKTASEVGHFLPGRLSKQEKLAALRTMIGMTNRERAAYIDRIKWAADEAAKEEGEESDDEYMSEEEKKEIEAAKEEKQKEKEAAFILRRLGLGR